MCPRGIRKEERNEGRKREGRDGKNEKQSERSQKRKKREITPNFGRQGGRIQRHFKTALTSCVIEGNLSQSSFSLFFKAKTLGEGKVFFLFISFLDRRAWYGIFGPWIRPTSPELEGRP